MFTPQRKAPWTPSHRHVSTATAKGKAVAFIDGPPPPPPPPFGSLTENVGGTAVAVSAYDSGNVEDWRRFREAGLLDEAALERRDLAALIEKISRLEKELFDYQYNMGLLLIEKTNLSSKCEELSQDVAEAEEILKREQTAHLNAMSDIEKREENLKSALNLEKKRVLDLHRALSEICEGHAKIMVTSERTIAEADACIAEVETKRLEVEGRSHLADAKLAEIDRKNSQIDRKLQDVEVRENIYQRECLSLNEEREAHEAVLRKHKDELWEWERTLQERERRLCENRRIFNEREEKLNESEGIYKIKENDLDHLQNKIDLANQTLKDMEDNIDTRLADLVSKDQKIDSTKSNLQLRENQLLLLEERLSAKERVEIQKHLDEHRASLDTEMQQLELDMEQKKNSLDEELKSELCIVDQKELEISHQKAKLGKQEEVLEKRSERVKEKERDVELKMKALKGREKYVKSVEKKLELEKKHMIGDNESIHILKDDIDKLRTEIKNQEMQIHDDTEKRKIADVERSEHLHMQLNLKREIERWRHQNEVMLKELEDLKRERENFEKDWEALDEKRAKVDGELRKIEEENSRLERSQCLEVERLKKEKLKMEQYLKQEMEGLRLEQDSFKATVKQEQLVLAENAQEHTQVLQNFEQRQRELENDMHKRREEMEKRVKDRERVFEEERLLEIRNINESREVAERQKEETESGRLQMEKEKQGIELERTKLEEDQHEIHKDIHTLSILRKQIKDQREQLISERTSFLSVTETLKACKTCGDLTREFILSDLQLPMTEDKKSHRFQNMDGQIVNNFEGDALTYDKESRHLTHVRSSDSDGLMSRLRKCTSGIISKLSPNKRIEHTTAHGWEDSAYFSVEACKDENFDKLTGEAKSQNDPSVNDLSNIGSRAAGVPNESQQSELQNGPPKRGRKRRAAINRTHSVKAVVEDAKLILGETSERRELNVDEQPNESAHLSDTGPEKSSRAGKAAGTTARKRSHAQVTRTTDAEQDVDHSEGRASSVATGSRRKRQQTVRPTPGEKRYNLRRHKIAGSASTSEALDDQAKHDKVAADNANGFKQAARKLELASSMMLGTSGNGKGTGMEHLSTGSVEFSSDRGIKFKNSAVVYDDDLNDGKLAVTTLSGEVRSFENTLSEEVNDTPENGNEDKDEDMLCDYGDDEDGDDDDSSDHPGQVSIPKKIWKFFIT
ncbi:hypothetical protein Ancab_018587 [Ancistrocladus abbreviatus]